MRGIVQNRISGGWKPTTTATKVGGSEVITILPVVTTSPKAKEVRQTESKIWRFGAGSPLSICMPQNMGQNARGGGGGEEKPLSGITSSMANGDVPNPAHAHNTCLPLAAVPTEAAMELGFLTAAPC